MTDTLEQIRHKVDGAVDVDPEHGRYRGRREAFTDHKLRKREDAESLVQAAAQGTLQ